MGIDLPALEFLLNARAVFGRFGRTLLLGRQRMLVTLPPSQDRALQALLAHDRAAALSDIDGTHCDKLFEFLGSSQLHVMDNSSYEGAGVIHDLNEPLPQHLKRQYDTVVDIGTLEHVFNIGEAMKSMADLVGLNGRFLSLNIANHHLGHGFWQFSPESYYRVFDTENGFRVGLAHLYYKGAFHELEDPDQAGRRIPIATPGYTYICFGAERVAEVPLFRHGWPVQADYQSAWTRFLARQASATGDFRKAEQILQDAMDRRPKNPSYRTAMDELQQKRP